MITLNTLQDWLNAPVENEHLKFKEAKNRFDTTKLFKYCVAMANEGGGHKQSALMQIYKRKAK